MYCHFERVNEQLVRCLYCDQVLESAHNPDHIRARCTPDLGTNVGHEVAQTRVFESYRRRPLRAVMITPGLQLGGAEIWVRTMVTEMDPNRVQWQAVLIANSFTQLNERLVRPISERTRIIAAKAELTQPIYPGVIERYESRKAAAQIALKDADVVVCWAVGGVLHELITDFAGPVIAVSHGVCRWTKADMQREVASGATHTVAVGSLAAAVCPNPSATDVIFNGVNPARTVSRRPREEIRLEWGFEDLETVLVGYVGRFAPEKNATAAAVAVASLPPRFQAVLVGEAANASLADHTQRVAVSIAGPRVKLIGVTEDVGEVYAAIDILVMASPAEGCSLTLIEAWLAGVPVVSTPVGIIPEMEERFGQMVIRIPIDPTAEELAQAVREAALAGRDSDVVKRASRVAHEHLTSARMTENWATFMEEVCPVRPTENAPDHTPKISIVVPAWNEATRIEKSLRSILAQTDQDFELIVVDDGSTDGTAEIAIEILAGRHNTRVITKENGGTGSALNCGFRLARGEFLTWWSADCWVYPRWLELLCNCLESNPEVVLAYGDWDYFDETSGIRRTQHVPEFDKPRLLRECYVGPCWLFRRAAKEAAGEYLEEPCEDYDMHLRLAEIGPFQHVPHVLGVWRNHPMNITSRLTSNPESTRWYGQAKRIQMRHRRRIKSCCGGK